MLDIASYIKDHCNDDFEVLCKQFSLNPYTRHNVLEYQDKYAVFMGEDADQLVLVVSSNRVIYRLINGEHCE